jgi:hypothetical protein
MKGTTFVGLIAFGSTVFYLFLKNKSNDKNSIQGIEIKINPEKLVDGALAMTNMNPVTKDGIRNVAHNAIKKYYDME